MSREIMQQALNALEYHTEHTYPFHQTNVAMEALRQALAQPEPFKPDWVSYRQGVADGAAQPEQEPVAWLTLIQEAQAIVKGKYLFKRFIDGTPLANDIAVWMTEFALKYATPHSAKGSADSAETFGKREWVGLTDDEIKQVFIDSWKVTEATDYFARAIEAALRSKNV